MKRIGVIFSVLLGLSACTSVPDNAPPISVSFAFSPSDRCGETSPAIQVSGAPAGTVKYKVSMTDLDVPGFNHGGGTVDAQAGGNIPRGALKSFSGPCPPTGQHSYRITVVALDGSGKAVGAGSATRRF